MIKTTDGIALRILARGDCTSRRSIALNQDMFERAPVFVQNEKSMFIQFLDAAQGKTATEEYLLEISDVENMPRVLRSFYMGQANRSILSESDGDLLIVDSYADMNFQLWEHKEHGFKFWIHPKFIYDMTTFKGDHVNLGFRQLDDSVNDAVEFINLIRQTNPGIPVLFLNQQVDYYPKLTERSDDFSKLGELVAAKLPDVFYGGVIPKDELELADIGSCGPGNTLHFQGGTYRKMWDRAFANGLQDAITARRAVKSSRRPANQSAVQPSTTYGELTFSPSPNQNIVITETVDIDLQVGGDDCVAACQQVPQAVHKLVHKYFYFDGATETGGPPRFTPMLIDLMEYDSFEDWEKKNIRKFSGGEKLRQKRKALVNGYYTKEFPYKLHIPDVYEINNSMDTRSGGPIRDNLRRSIEDMGGAPVKAIGVPTVKCPRHWRKTFGVFIHAEGHSQGNVVVNERLAGFISIQRHGEFAIYTQFIGHGDDLANGILSLMHHDVIEYLYNDPLGEADGLRYVMYGGVQNGGSGLFQFKRRSGFKPYIVNVPPVLG